MEDDLPYDLILLDLNLPRMTGAQFVAELAGESRGRKVPIMILSGAPGSQVIGVPTGDRPVGYILKPDELDGYKEIARFVANGWQASDWSAPPNLKIRFKAAI